MTGEDEQANEDPDPDAPHAPTIYGKSARVARRVISEGRYLRLVDVDGWEFAERKNASGVVAIVAITPSRTLLLTEQHRRAVDRAVVDLPAGLAGDTPGDESEALANAAKRELLEEVGYDATTMEELATTPPSPGMTSELVTFFRAGGLSKVNAGGGVGGEGITVHEVALDALDRFLADRMRAGALIDVKLYAGLHLALRGS